LTTATADRDQNLERRIVLLKPIQESEVLGVEAIACNHAAAGNVGEGIIDPREAARIDLSRLQERIPREDIGDHHGRTRTGGEAKAGAATVHSKNEIKNRSSIINFINNTIKVLGGLFRLIPVLWAGRQWRAAAAEFTAVGGR